MDAVQTHNNLKCNTPSPASSVGIANRYGLEGPGIEFWERRDFSLRPDRAHSSKVKWPGRDLNHPPPSSAEVRERAELYFYSTSGSSWPVIG